MSCVAKKVIFKKIFTIPLKQISIKNEFLSLKVLNYGAIIQECLFTDGSAPPTPLVVGFEDPGRYIPDKTCMGACVGRFAGRISGGFQLDGEAYSLHTVVKDVHLHGGQEGFSKKYWDIDEVRQGKEPFATLSYLSPHLEEGYPGALRAKVTYRLKRNALEISHQATADRKTIINLVNHSYFLFGESPHIRDYQMWLNCNEYLETEENLLPTGRVLPVEGTPFDFTNARPLGETSLDTPYVTGPGRGDTACIYAPGPGIRMRVQTNQPGLIVYTPRDFAGICFETQNLPDAPNMPHFPSCVLEKGAVYENTSVFLFDRPEGDPFAEQWEG